jgi:predicted deacetylase
MRLVVAIHDVTPAHAGAVTELWRMCSVLAIRPALFVVPDWHGEFPLERYPDFVAWVRTQARAGGEIVLHGERHDEQGLPRRWRDQLRAWGRTAREAEFLTLDEAAARTRIGRGLSRLRALELEPTGFVPPAWLASQATHRVAGEAGLRFTEDAASIRLHPGDQRIAAPAYRWSARTGFRAWGSVVVAAGRHLIQRRADLVRLALHPLDLSHPAVAASISDTLLRLGRERHVVRYADLTGA